MNTPNIRFTDWPGAAEAVVYSFCVPKRMWKEVSETVELRLSPKARLRGSERRAVMMSFSSRGEPPHEQEIEIVGRRMSAALLADLRFLDVMSLNSDEQDIDLERGRFLRWD